MHRTRSPYYMELPRSRRVAAFVRQRTKIAADLQGKGVFFSPYLMPGGPQWNSHMHFFHGSHGHTECQFLSRGHARQGVWYDAEVCTVAQRVAERWSALVDQRLEKMLAAHGLTLNDVHGDTKFVKDPLTQSYTMETTPSPALAAFGGQTVWHLKHRLWHEVSIEDCKDLTEGYFVNTKHRYGVKLCATVPNEEVSVSTTVAAIERFWVLGERNVSFAIDWERHVADIADVRRQQLEYLEFRLSEL